MLVDTVPWYTEYEEFRALRAGVYFGALEIMVSLFKTDKWDVNVTDSFGRSALIWATRMGMMRSRRCY